MRGATILLFVAAVALAAPTFAQAPDAKPTPETVARTSSASTDDTAPETPGAQPPQTADAIAPAREKADRDEGASFRVRPAPSFRVGSALRVDLKYRTQWNAEDGDGADEADEDASIADFADHRVGVEGKVFDDVEFEIERDVTGNDPWRDVFVNVATFRFAEVKAGQFRVPFSLDEQTGSASRDFVYRSLAARQLAPGRDVGVMIHGRALGRRVGYQLGVFRQDGRNARPGSDARVSGERTLAARLIVQPWRGRKTLLEDLQFGAATTASDVPLGLPALRAESVLGTVLDRPVTPVAGPRRRTGLELRWRPGPFSVRSEYMRVTTAREGQGPADADLSPLLGTGWYVSGTWALTGERKADGLLRPRRPLFDGGAGAFELAARLERLELRSVATGLDVSTSPRADIVPAIADRATTVGLNWYLNRYVKVQANLVHEQFTDASPLATTPRRSSWSRLLQLQFSL